MGTWRKDDWKVELCFQSPVLALGRNNNSGTVPRVREGGRGALAVIRTRSPWPDTLPRKAWGWIWVPLQVAVTHFPLFLSVWSFWNVFTLGVEETEICLNLLTPVNSLWFAPNKMECISPTLCPTTGTHIINMHRTRTHWFCQGRSRLGKCCTDIWSFPSPSLPPFLSASFSL